MAEKRVSVRLAAVGGKQVRADLEGVGTSGARGFKKISKEAEAANRKLAAFSRRVKLAATVAVGAAAAAGVAMVKSGLKTIDAQAKLAASLGTTTSSIQVLERAGGLAGISMGEVEQASKKLTTRLSQAAVGTGPAVDALKRLHLTAVELQALPLDQRIATIQDALAKFVPPAERAAVAAALFGDRAALSFSLIDSATLRLAAKDIADFGVATSEMDAAQIQTTNDAISRLGLVWLGLSNQLAVAAAPALEAVANAMAAATRVGGTFQKSIAFLGRNLGEIASVAGAFATFFAGRFIFAMGAAALGLRGVTLGLVAIKGALIRTGIGALIVGAGELVFQFGRLVSGAGSFGAAMGLLKDVAVEVWDRIGMAASAAGAAATAMFLDLKSDVASAMQSAIESVVAFGNTAANTFEGAFEAIKAIWGLLPAAIGDLAFQAANSLVDGVEAMLNGVVARINGFIASINTGLEALGSARRITLLGDLDLGGIENRFAGAATQAATAAKDAFDRAFADNPLAVPDVGLSDIAREALTSANIFRTAATDLADGARAPLASWRALRDAVVGAASEGEAALAAAQVRMNEALGLYAQVGGPNARAEAIASTEAYIAEASAKLEDAEATLALMRAKQTARNALLDQNPLTRDDRSQDSTGEAMARNVEVAAAAVAELQTELAAARARLKELEDAKPADPISQAVTAANGLTGALAGASGKASALSQFLSSLPGALAGSASNIAGLRAGIATLSGGGDAAAASVAKYRAELVASLPPLASLQDGQRAFVQDSIEQKVRLFEQEQKLSAEYQAQVAALAEVAVAASGAGGAAAAAAAEPATEAAVTGWQAVTAALSDYASKAREIGGDIGQSLVGAFTSAENAIGEFVKTGKLNFRDLVTSLLADLAKLAARRFILGPIANALSGALGGAGGLFAGVFHSGGMVGSAGPGRMVPAMAFVNAPRMHDGGFAGLRPDEVPAILQRGERVLSRRETAGQGASGAPAVNVTIMARDAESFRQSRTQVAADIARAVSLGRRGM